MSKQFVAGNTYVFTKKKFIQSEGKQDFKRNSWTNMINGQKVEIVGADTAVCHELELVVIPEWCKCIKVGANNEH